MPAIPPAPRPCGRTAEALKWSSWASEVTKTSSSSPERSSTAPTTSSPSLSAMTSQVDPFGASGVTRLTTPWAVPRARPGESGESEVRVRTRSSAPRSRYAPTGAPPESEGASFVGGSVGSSRAPTRATRPALVTMPTSPRAVVRIAATTPSCLARPPERDGSSSVVVRAISPVVESRTQHGSSAISIGVLVAAGVPADSSSTVRRGVPCFFATSPSSVLTSLMSTFSSPRISSSSAIWRRSSSCSCSSSSLENFVSRRSWRSRM